MKSERLTSWHGERLRSLAAYFRWSSREAKFYAPEIARIESARVAARPKTEPAEIRRVLERWRATLPDM